MEQAGVPRSIATKITGHKTEAIYKRYAVSNESDMDRAAALIETRANGAAQVRAASATSHSTSHSGPSASVQPRKSASDK